MEVRQDDIIRKIAALRRLAEKAGTPEEAAAAAAKAQKLLEDHNIFEAQIAGFNPDDLGAFIDHEGVVIKQSWRQMLMSGLAHGNFCRILRARDYGKGGGGRPWVYKLIGRRENIEVTLDTLAWMTDLLNSMANKAYRDTAITYHMQGMTMRESQSNWVHAFKCGAAETIRNRILAEREASKRDVTKTKALIVIDDQLDQAFRKFHPNTRRIGQRGGASSVSAQAAGRAAGQGVSLSRPRGLGRQGRIG